MAILIELPCEEQYRLAQVSSHPLLKLYNGENDNVDYMYCYLSQRLLAADFMLFELCPDRYKRVYMHISYFISRLAVSMKPVTRFLRIPFLSSVLFHFVCTVRIRAGCTFLYFGVNSLSFPKRSLPSAFTYNFSVLWRPSQPKDVSYPFSLCSSANSAISASMLRPF